MVLLLKRYYEKENKKTITEIINAWAPPVENNTRAYIDAVSNALKIGPDQNLATFNFELCSELVKAIAEHENGTTLYLDPLSVQSGIGLALEQSSPVTKTVK